MRARGFSYPEVLAVVILMGVALAPMVESLSLSAHGASSVRDHYLMLIAAREKMEDVLALDFTSVSLVENFYTDTVTIGGKSLERKVTVALYDIDGDSVDDVDVKQITVTVWGDMTLKALAVDR